MESEATSDPGIEILTGLPPARALGLAVSHLMNRPPFSEMPFGAWSRSLVGQINRNHYRIASDGSRVVGFLGWALTTRERAERWLTEHALLSDEDSQEGEALIVIAWSSERPDVTQLLLDRLREVLCGRESIFFLRVYPDGRTRPGRLAVNAFVAAHVRAARRAARARVTRAAA